MKAYRSRPKLLTAAIGALLALLAAIPVWGQQGATATIEGVVTDPNGAVVAQARVVARNAETGFTRELSTDASGVYRLTLLPPGTYEVTVTAPNFAELKRSNLQLTVGQKLNLDLQLRVTGAAETVTITAQAPVVETTRTQVSGSINARAVSELPVNGRNFLDFVTLTPGVVRDPRQGDLAFGGQRGTLNSLQIDGVDNNNLFFGQALGRTGSGRAPYQFSQDAVQEFQVNTNTFSAEFGRAAGGVINVITKSGTNEFHGTAFEFYRDRSLNANSLRFDSTRNAMIPNTVKPPYHWHQFGGTFGGPIKRDRAFFFFSYDGQRNTEPNVVNLGAAAPSDAASQQGLARLLPFVQNYTRGRDQDVYLGKADIHLDQSNRLSVRYNHQSFTGRNFENGGPQTAQERSGNSLVTTDTVTVTLHTAFSPRLLNEFRTQVARDKEPGTANSDNPQATINQGGRTVFVIGRNFFSPRETTEDKYQFINNLSYLAGAHSLRGGFDINVERIKNFFPGSFGAEYVFDSYADFANNRVSRYVQAFAGPGTTGPTTFPNFNEFGFFFQDDWRARPNLTINLGVRYDVQKMRETGITNPSAALAAARIDTGRIHNDYNNIAPRLGFAWKPTANHSFVVRGGYGIFYGRTPAIALATAHSNNGLNVVNIQLNNPTLPFTYPGRFSSLSQILALGAPSTPNLFIFDRNHEQPYTQQASLGLEYGLTDDLAVSANYLFVKGTHLPRTRDINLPAPVSTPMAGFPNFLRHPGAQGNPTRPIAGFGRISQFEGSANSNYNALVLQLNKRFAQNFQLLFSYTWSKVIDDVPDATSVVPFSSGDDAKQVQHSFFLRDDRGPGVADIPHRFVASGVWDLAYFRNLSGAGRALLDGWQLSGILQANSNQPFSAQLGRTDLNNDANRETDRVPGFGRNSFHRGKFVSFDFRMAKTFFFTEKYRLQFIGEFFNVLNRVNFATFNTQFAAVNGLGTAGVSLSPRADFGDPRTTFEQRIGQLALKFIF
jgi:outer membrane receptor protein involved in Fe transport